jgi:hypothetical protein
MTDGHRHRTITLERDSIRLHLLQTPLRVTRNRFKPAKSRWVWGKITDCACGEIDISTYHWVSCPIGVQEDRFLLTPLSLLHTLVGLTVNVKERR